jgi:hypothetical protein
MVGVQNDVDLLNFQTCLINLYLQAVQVVQIQSNMSVIQFQLGLRKALEI